MRVRKTGYRDTVIVNFDANSSQAMTQDEAITLRDLLLREFPVPLDEHERQRLAEMNVELFSRVEKILRRERIATAVLAGFAAHPDVFRGDKAIASAVEWADGLIAALDKDKPS